MTGSELVNRSRVDFECRSGFQPPRRLADFNEKNRQPQSKQLPLRKRPGHSAMFQLVTDLHRRDRNTVCSHSDFDEAGNRLVFKLGKHHFLTD